MNVEATHIPQHDRDYNTKMAYTDCIRVELHRLGARSGIALATVCDFASDTLVGFVTFTTPVGQASQVRTIQSDVTRACRLERPDFELAALKILAQM